jgi:hypothetical protein
MGPKKIQRKFMPWEKLVAGGYPLNTELVMDQEDIFFL